ncbi:MAG: peptide/nickel transport system ATP-binding protein [Thermococcaceae archaeon]|nr:peptide/nickel transport system ATP-binding protein [Thermococcaceae archaeon]
MSLLSVRDLKIYYRTPVGYVKAVDGVSFDVREGEVEQGRGTQDKVY